jgi:hypothetical protein
MKKKRRKIMGKGSSPRKGHNQEKQSKNYDAIDWTKGKKSNVKVRINGKKV